MSKVTEAASGGSAETLNELNEKMAEANEMATLADQVAEQTVSSAEAAGSNV